MNDKALETAFNRAWPEFEEKIVEIHKSPAAAFGAPRTPEDMLEEVLTICRSIDHDIKVEKLFVAAMRPPAVTGAAHAAPHRVLLKRKNPTASRE